MDKLSIIDIINSCPNQLKQATIENTKKFSLEGHCLAVRVLSVYDGDTIKVAVKLPNTSYHSPPVMFSVRLKGIDTAEIRTKNQAEKKIAMLARDHLHVLVHDKICCLEAGPLDSFGRIVGVLYTQDGVNVNQELLDSGFAIPYNQRRDYDWDMALLRKNVN